MLHRGAIKMCSGIELERESDVTHQITYIWQGVTN